MLNYTINLPEKTHNYSLCLVAERKSRNMQTKPVKHCRQNNSFLPKDSQLSV